LHTSRIRPWRGGNLPELRHAIKFKQRAGLRPERLDAHDMGLTARVIVFSDPSDVP
jgi:hypothetical protein